MDYTQQQAESSGRILEMSTILSDQVLMLENLETGCDWLWENIRGVLCLICDVINVSHIQLLQLLESTAPFE